LRQPYVALQGVRSLRPGRAARLDRCRRTPHPPPIDRRRRRFTPFRSVDHRDPIRIQFQGERNMARPVTLFTGQWADLTLEVIAQKASQWGYDGIELPCWGDHFNVQKALSDPGYCKGRHELLGKSGLKCWAISNHLVGQLVLDHNDSRTDDWVPAEVRGDAQKKTEWAIQEMKDTARAAQK